MVDLGNDGPCAATTALDKVPIDASELPCASALFVS